MCYEKGEGGGGEVTGGEGGITESAGSGGGEVWGFGLVGVDGGVGMDRVWFCAGEAGGGVGDGDGNGEGDGEEKVG